MRVRNEVEGVEPMDALHTVVHVACRGWLSFGRRLRGPDTARVVLTEELVQRTLGMGLMWTAITEVRA